MSFYCGIDMIVHWTVELSTGKRDSTWWYPVIRGLMTCLVSADNHVVPANALLSLCFSSIFLTSQFQASTPRWS